MRVLVTALVLLLAVGALAMGTLATSATAFAQIPQTLQGVPITGVEVVGPARRTTPVRAVGIPLGAPLTRTLLRATVERLLATGRWADVQLDVVAHENGAQVRAFLVPRVIILRVDVRGNDEFDGTEVARALRVSAGSVIREDDLSSIANRLRTAYASEGFESAVIELSLRETDDPSRQLLIVEIQEGDATEVDAIVFDGDAPPRGSGLVGALGVGVGDRLDREEVERAARDGELRLRERGYYEARLRLAGVEPLEGARARLRYSLHVGPRYQVRISGHGLVARDDIVDALNLKEERLTQGQLPAMTVRVADLFRRYGFADAQVEVVAVRPTRPPPGIDAIVLVRIVPGTPLQVERREYPGAHHFDRGFLEDQMESFLEEAIDVDSPFDPVDDHEATQLLSATQERRHAPRPLHTEPGAVWYEPAYEAAIEHVQELYRADGFLEARVGPVTLERMGPGSARVVMPVFEGPRARLYGVTLAGNDSMSARDVLTASGLARGQPFSYLALERAKDRIARAYQARGYYYASAEASVRFSGDRTRAEVSLLVRERFEVLIRGVRIEGADRTNETLVRRVASIDDGDLLTPQLLRRAQDRLLDLGIFSSVSASPIEPDLPARSKEILLVLTERRTQYLDFRVGVSTAQGARFGFEYGIRNIRGLALEASLRAQFGYQFFFLDDTLEQRFTELSLQDRLERRVVLTLSAPYIGIPNVRASLSISNLRENERNFGLDANTIDLTFAWRPERWLNFSLSGGVENNEIAVLGAQSYQEILDNTTDPRLRGLLRVPEGVSTLVAANVLAALDRRDSPFTPTRGYFASVSTEWAKTVRDSVVVRGDEEETFSSHHLRFQLSASGYVPLGRKVVFAAQVRFGSMLHLSSLSETYPNRKFFLGGVDTIRGYLQDALVPQDIADEICDPAADGCALPADFNVNAVVQGGDIFMVVRGELRFPIYGSFQGGTFVDFGNSWVNASEFNPIRLRPTAGFGIRISTPVGPIAFDYGILLARRRFLGEPFGSFHFSIGLF